MRLNTKDPRGLVHYVASSPSDLMYGRTICWKDFTWPIYSSRASALLWTGTEEPPSCFHCVLLGPL